jgi:ferric-dicitrate binding protein FerR (iron transport regulator)
MMNEEIKPYRNYKSTDFFEDDRFIRYVLHPTIEEDLHWNELTTQYPEIKPPMAEARTWILLLNRQKIQQPRTAAGEIWDRIAPRLKQSPKGMIRSLPMRRAIKWTSGVAAMLMLCFMMWEWTQHGVHRYKTEYGATNNISLPDGSLVMLNGNSSIRYKRGWSSAKPRELWLEGEAFFRVQHVALKNRWQQADSFRVHVNGLDVTVTGTQFNISNRRKTIEITLLQGALRIDKQGPGGFTATLRPGEVLRFDSTRRTSITRPANPGSKNAWTRQEMDLDGYTLTDIIRILEDSYGYEITLDNPELAQKKLTGTIPAASGEDIIFVIEKVFNLSVARNGRQLVIKKI